LKDADLEKWDVVVGEILAPHGVRGTVRVFPLTEYGQRFKAGATFCALLPNGEQRWVTIRRSQRFQQKFWLIDIEGCQTREDAETLRGATLNITAAMRAPLRRGRYYVSDIVGMNVVTTDGRALGVITEVLQTGSNDVYVTERVLIPATKEVVKEIDVAGKRMVVEAVPGLIEDEG
jgi:16S rRNA processing protein RimM